MRSVSHSFATSQKEGAEFGVAADRIYHSHEDMAEQEAKRADGIDFAVICTPNAYHYPAAKAFMEKGINVACDQAPVPYAAGSGRPEKDRTGKQRFVLPDPHLHRASCVARSAALYRKGVIGELRTVVVEYPQDWLLDALEKETEETKTWRSVPALSGRGAAIGDIGSHMENWVHFVTGPAGEKSARKS